jgi:hypothetical protein
MSFYILYLLGKSFYILYLLGKSFYILLSNNYIIKGDNSWVSTATSNTEQLNS